MGQRRTRNLQDLICSIRVACTWINVPAGVQVIVLCQRRSLSGGMDVRRMHQGGFESQNERGGFLRHQEAGLHQMSPGGPGKHTAWRDKIGQADPANPEMLFLASAPELLDHR